MLFCSYEFIFLFFPIVLIGFYLLKKTNHPQWSLAWLVVASFFFYGYWKWSFLGLFAFSCLANYGLAVIGTKAIRHSIRTFVFLVALAFNLAVIFYFKYSFFALTNINAIFNLSIQFDKLILPLGISFYTFQQIAYQVDVYRERRCERSLLRYLLFVSFFPQLIAGPIVHHKEVLPQFNFSKLKSIEIDDCIQGLAFFSIGLFKKVVLADNVAHFSTPLFSAALHGESLAFMEAWLAVLSYTFQIYFDFSGYSDMAIGLGKFFGITLPVNFYSPYKAHNVIEFWRRWHITLSIFLRDYLYIPLGGSRRGKVRRYFNLMITMLLGGLWHGASWNFVFWGILHGFYLVVNHLYKYVRKKFNLNELFFIKILSPTATFLCVIMAWVLFRAETFESAMSIYRSLVMVKFDSPIFSFQHLGPFSSASEGGAWVFVCAFICFVLPNSYEFIMRQRLFDRGHSGRVIFKTTLLYALLIGIILGLGILSLSTTGEFIYFQF